MSTKIYMPDGMDLESFIEDSGLKPKKIKKQRSAFCFYLEMRRHQLYDGKMKISDLVEEFGKEWERLPERKQKFYKDLVK